MDYTKQGATNPTWGDVPNVRAPAKPVRFLSLTEVGFADGSILNISLTTPRSYQATGGQAFEYLQWLK